MENLTENQLDYARMLEIPVSTVSVVKKKSLFRRKARAEDLKEQVVESVNERAGFNDAVTAENSEAAYPRYDFVQSENLSESAPAAAANPKRDGYGVILLAEAVAACLIAGGIFLTNVFLPNSAINTMLGNLAVVEEKEVAYNELELAPVVSQLSDAEVTVTEDGVICFTERASVYPVCEGTVASVTEADGLYTVQIAHTSTFSSVFTGLTTVYAAQGEKLQTNIPFAYSSGENEVRVSMYDGETLLDCYTLSGAVPVWNS